MENVFIFSLLIIFSSTLGMSTIKSINADYTFNSINESVFAASIDPNLSGINDEYTLVFDRIKLERNIVEIVSYSKMKSAKFTLQFSYYNVATKLDCLKQSLACNGVFLEVRTNILFFYKERTYTYEIVKQK